MTIKEQFASKVLEQINEKYNSYLRIVNKEGTCAAFIKKEIINQMWGVSVNEKYRKDKDKVITYPVTYLNHNVWFVYGPDTWREPTRFIRHNCTAGPLGQNEKYQGDLLRKIYSDKGISVQEIVDAIYRDHSNFWLHESDERVKGDPHHYVDEIHVIDKYFSSGDWKCSEFAIKTGDKMLKELEEFIPYRWKEKGPFLLGSEYTYYLNMDRSKIDKKDNPKTCFDLEYKYDGEKFNAFKMSIDEFKLKLLNILGKDEDSKDMFESLKINVNDISLVDLARMDINYIPWYTLCSMAGVEDCGYDFSFENNEAEYIGITKNGVPFIYGWAGGDWENPVGIILYWNDNKLNYFIPLWGNTIRTDTLKAIGNDYEGEINGVSDTDYVINQLAPWMKGVYDKDELDEMIYHVPIEPNREAIIDAFSKAVNPV